jgi:hypothetical protein
MKIESKFLVAGLSTAAFAAGGCSSSNHETTSWHVGEDQWVGVEKSITQHYVNADERLRAGEECLMVRGAKLLFKDGKITYVHNDALGTECPNDAQVNISPTQAKSQDRKFQAFEARRDEVVGEVSRMDSPQGPLVDIGKGWVDVVNSQSIEQVYANGIEELAYGDSCLAVGKAQKIGHLQEAVGSNPIIRPIFYDTRRK